jgi:hypothetical protein
MSSKLFLLYVFEVPRALFPIIDFYLFKKRLKCPGAHWSDPTNQNQRIGSVKLNRVAPFSLTHTRSLALATKVAITVASPFWPSDTSQTYL